MTVTISNKPVGTQGSGNWTNSQLFDSLEYVFGQLGYHSGTVAYDVPTFCLYPGSTTSDGKSDKSHATTLWNRCGGRPSSSSTYFNRYFDVTKNGTQGYYVKEYWQPTGYDATNDTITVHSNTELQTGKKLRWNPGQVSESNNITGLTLDSDYYVVRVDSTTIKLATSRANAVAPTPTTVDLGGTGTPANGWTSATRFYTPETSESENTRIIIRYGDKVYWNFPNSDGDEFKVVQQDLSTESYDSTKECIYANRNNIDSPGNETSNYQVQYTSADLVKWEHTGYWNQTENRRTEPISGFEGTANASVSGGFITSITVTSSGYGYDPNEPPTITFSGGGGSGAKATCTVSTQGTISGFTIVSAGSGYTSAPTVNILAGNEVVPIESFEKPARLSKGCNSYNYASGQPTSYAWISNRHYYYTNDTLPNLKGEILLLPRYYNGSYTYNSQNLNYYVKVLGTDVGLLSPDNDLYLRVSRYPFNGNSNSNTRGKPYGIEVCNIASAAQNTGQGWPTTASFTIKGSKTGGADGAVSGTNGDSGGNDIVFGTNTAATGTYTSDGKPSLHTTDYGGAANNKFYQRGSDYAVLKRKHQDDKTRGTSYYTFSIAKTNTGTDYRMFIDSGVYWETMNCAGTNHETIGTYSNQSAASNFKEYGFFEGIDGEEVTKYYNKFTNDGGDVNVSYIDITDSSAPHTYPHTIRWYTSTVDPQFAMISFIQTKNLRDYNWGTFTLNGGSNFGNPNPVFDLDELYHGSFTKVVNDANDVNSSSHPYGITFISQMAGHHNGYQSKSASAEPKNDYTKTREAMYGYFRNGQGYYNGAHTIYTPNIDLQTDNRYNANGTGRSRTAFYFRDNTYDGTLNSLTNYYKPISGIPIDNSLIPCPYYLPDDYVMIQVGSTPGATLYSPGDTVTISAGVEVYTIVTAAYVNNTEGLDGVANGTTKGMLFCVRTT
tara:strand:+ start:2472 stop:5309 length:2838 start_codon:yes stop_codon:yes gene_type:complete